MKTKNPMASERRRFLTGMMVTGGAATLAAMAPQVTAEASAATPDEGPERRGSKGYRLTAHVRDYYRSLRL